MWGCAGVLFRLDHAGEIAEVEAGGVTFEAEEFVEVVAEAAHDLEYFAKGLSSQMS